MDESIEPFERPELTKDEIIKTINYAIEINNIRDIARRQVYLIALIRENIVLLKECNELRKALGLDPLPVIDNSNARIA